MKYRSTTEENQIEFLNTEMKQINHRNYNLDFMKQRSNKDQIGD